MLLLALSSTWWVFFCVAVVAFLVFLAIRKKH